MELKPVQAAAGPRESSPGEGVAGPEKPAVMGSEGIWLLVAPVVERIRRTKDTVRSGTVSRLRQALHKNDLRVDPDLIATLLLDEIAPV